MRADAQPLAEQQVAGWVELPSCRLANGLADSGHYPTARKNNL